MIYITNSGKRKPVEYVNHNGDYILVRWGTGQTSSVHVSRCKDVPSRTTKKKAASTIDYSTRPDGSLELNLTNLSKRKQLEKYLEAGSKLASDGALVIDTPYGLECTRGNETIHIIVNPDILNDEPLPEESPGTIKPDKRTKEYKLMQLHQERRLTGCELMLAEDIQAGRAGRDELKNINLGSY